MREDNTFIRIEDMNMNKFVGDQCEERTMNAGAREDRSELSESTRRLPDISSSRKKRNNSHVAVRALDAGEPVAARRSC